MSAFAQGRGGGGGTGVRPGGAAGPGGTSMTPSVSGTGQASVAPGTGPVFTPDITTTVQSQRH